MPLILNNSMSADLLGLRTSRLIMLSANIDEYSAEIGLSQATIDWGIASKDTWVDALSNSNLQRGECDTAYETYYQIFDDAKEYYQKLKALLLANIADIVNKNEYTSLYGIAGPSPRTLGDFYASVRKMKEANEALTTPSTCLL